MKDKNDMGALCATEGDAVPCLVPADSATARRERVLSGEFDAAVWAREFMIANTEHRVAESESTMLGWFADAIMAGYDHAKRQPVWQPIETAPEDRACVLYVPNRYPHVVIGAYWATDEITRWGWWAGAQLVQPTHWMPLPEPPR